MKNILNYLKRDCIFYNKETTDFFIVDDLDCLFSQKVKIYFCTRTKIEFGEYYEIEGNCCVIWVVRDYLEKLINSENIVYLGDNTDKRIVELKEKVIKFINTKNNLMSTKYSCCSEILEERYPVGMTVKRYKELLSQIPDNYIVHFADGFGITYPLGDKFEINVDHTEKKIIL